MKQALKSKYIFILIACLVFTACGAPVSHEPVIQTTHDITTEVAIEEEPAPQQNITLPKTDTTDITINQLGYFEDSRKIAVFHTNMEASTFSVVDAETNRVIYTDELYQRDSDSGLLYGDFTAFSIPGRYYIACDGIASSYVFSIRNDVYDMLAEDMVHMFYLQRCGTVIDDVHFNHTVCHTAPATIYGTTKSLPVNGGWHDAGDFGRYIVPAAQSVVQLLYAYGASPQLYTDQTGIPESGNGIPDLLDEVRYELEWMLKMQSSNGGVYHKVTCTYHPGMILPEGESDALIITPISTTATADFCGTMALAYEYFADIDTDFAHECLSAARNSWKYLQKHPEFQYDNPADIYTGTYEDASDEDERYWAAAQMYHATGEDQYYHALDSLPAGTGLGWQSMSDYGNLAILTMDGIDISSQIYSNAYNAILSQADYFLSVSERSPYEISLEYFYWGSNMGVANAGVILALAYELTANTDYYNAAQANLHYLLGQNPLKMSFVTGEGTHYPQNPHHRIAFVKKKTPKGMLVGGVNPNLEDPTAQQYLNTVPENQRYIDHVDSYSTNEVAIYWNSAMIYLLSLLKE